MKGYIQFTEENQIDEKIGDPKRTMYKTPEEFLKAMYAYLEDDLDGMGRGFSKVTAMNGKIKFVGNRRGLGFNYDIKSGKGNSLL